MRRLPSLLCSLLLVLCLAPAARAQDATPTATATATATPDVTASPNDPADNVLDPSEIPPASTPDPSDVPCPQGTDGDYSGCTPCPGGADGDYAYCVPEPVNGGAGENGRGRSAPAAEVRLVATHTLPLTGSDAPLLALAGLGLLLAGVGLRLTLRPDGLPPSA